MMSFVTSHVIILIVIMLSLVIPCVIMSDAINLSSIMHIIMLSVSVAKLSVTMLHLYAECHYA
jgi:hypothetical protein